MLIFDDNLLHGWRVGTIFMLEKDCFVMWHSEPVRRLKTKFNMTLNAIDLTHNEVIL